MLGWLLVSCCFLCRKGCLKTVLFYFLFFFVLNTWYSSDIEYPSTQIFIEFSKIHDMVAPHQVIFI